MITCTKRYDDFPFAHRQPNHQGHCALIHGHNWGFEFEFAADLLDECGFVIDFGKLKWLKAWLNEHFDHTLTLNEGDPHLSYIRQALDTQPGDRGIGAMADLIVVPDCSCEGLAQWVLLKVSDMLGDITQGRVSLVRVTVFEDSKNSATAYNLKTNKA